MGIRVTYAIGGTVHEMVLRMPRNSTIGDLAETISVIQHRPIESVYVVRATALVNGV